MPCEKQENHFKFLRFEFSIYTFRNVVIQSHNDGKKPYTYQSAPTASFQILWDPDTAHCEVIANDV